jgi:hypothetical protein
VLATAQQLWVTSHEDRWLYVDQRKGSATCWSALMCADQGGSVDAGTGPKCRYRMCHICWPARPNSASDTGSRPLGNRDPRRTHHHSVSSEVWELRLPIGQRIIPPHRGSATRPRSAHIRSATHSILRVARSEARQLADRGFRAGSRSVRALSEHVAMGASDPAFGAVGNASGPRYRAAIARQGAWSPSEVLGPSPQPPIGRHPPARRAVYPRAADR